MPDRNHNNAAEPDQDIAPSKSELKRQMLALQRLGESLLELNEKQLALMPIADEQLVLAIRETHLIRSNSARKRHLQFIGKLMRNIDPQPLEVALQAMHQAQHNSNDNFHLLEQLRDDILAAGLPERLGDRLLEGR